jgi:hypothetical protein
MNTYLFTFNCVPSDNSWWTTYNKNNYFKTSASSLKEAEEYFFAYLEEKLYFVISKTARKKYNKMYRDTKEGRPFQVGKVFKASTEIEWNEKIHWKKVFADIWTEVNILNNPFEA